MTSLQTFGNIRTLDAIAQEAADTDYSVTLLPISDPTLRRVSGAYQRLSAQAVDGAVILLEARLLDQAEFALPPGIPVVLIDSGAGPDYTVVDTDQALGARQATEHLLRLGHRQIWHIAGPETAFSASRRAQSWARTLLEAGITAPPYCAATDIRIRLPARPDPWRAARRHRDLRGQRPDGAGVMRALHELGRDIPGDVSVIGFDDMAEASSFWPPLTTIHQDSMPSAGSASASCWARCPGRAPGTTRPRSPPSSSSAAVPAAARLNPCPRASLAGS